MNQRTELSIELENEMQNAMNLVNEGTDGSTAIVNADTK
jgi:hypothetical protein